MSRNVTQTIRVGSFWLGVTLIGQFGCGGSNPAGKADLPPPMVTVAPPVERVITQYEFDTGRCEPLEQVQIQARVNGYLNKIDFEPGREVEKGKVLFQIDPEQYKADLARAEANKATAEADLATAEADLGRAESKEATTKLSYDRQEAAYKAGSGSLADRDTAKGLYDEAVASVKAGKAKIKVAKAKIDEGKAAVQTATLNLGFCTIKAPISGVIGDKLVTEGNLVNGGGTASTLLTTIVSVEKMDVGFDVDENTLERIKQAVREGKIKPVAPGEVPAEAGLAIDGSNYPLKGKIVFADNKFDEKTGTVRMKARFDNPKPAVGPRLLTAGMYARIRVPIGEPVKAVLVPESSFGFDQGIKYLFLVGADNKAVRMDAMTGIQDGVLRVVESVQVPGQGKPRPLRPDDRIIVNGIQRVRPGMTVDPKPAKK
jgi:RND family efflux transporter MFP subunit